MLAMARHLAALGHRRIGVICMRLSNTRYDGYADPQRQRRASFPVQRERLRGLREGFAEAGVDWAEVPVVERFEHSIEAGASAASELMDAHLGLTALVCTSDVLALGALRMAEDRNWAVPDHLTVTGFDGVPEAIRAGLTTVLQPVKEKGRTAGQLLLNRGDRTEPRSIVLPTELIAGSTSGPPPAADRWFSGL
jgi:DNA-binding LacI/PurR family transcriptional regulator